MMKIKLRWNSCVRRWLAACILAGGAFPALAVEAGTLITALEGSASRGSANGPQTLQSFVRLKEGDLVALERGARLKLVYLANGRQENWEGNGRLEIGATESKSWGLKEPRVAQLPAVLVAQIAKTPTIDSQGRAGMTRLRAIASADAVARIEKTYRRLRAEAEQDDLNPEMYLLSGMLEIRALDRVEQAIEDLRASRPADPQAKLLVALYQHSLRNAKEISSRP
ncbi:hypothetical protein [Denitratisoma sp. DHT3]|uniref:hypothetical protein n=1 Tax=Denitratisoma sp. DHT3 TaxID=1981880 RepID=UPI0011A9233C|nr:hypothetical protein [Denitratisoma sp. DHT3]